MQFCIILNITIMLSLSRFQKKYKHRINRGLTYHYLRSLRSGIDFDFDVYLPSIGKNLQRPLCWTLEQKRALVLTVLRGRKLNSITVVQVKDISDNFTDSKYKFKVIGGKQRLTTLFAFMDNEFTIVVDGVEYRFSELPEDCRRQIETYILTWDVHYHYDDEPIADETLIDIFEDCNFLGTPVEIEHLNNLRS